MKKPIKRHILHTIGLSGLATGGMGLAYGTTQAKEGEVRVETIELDFEERVEVPQQPDNSDASAKTMGIENQFLFLLALTVLGLVGIAGLIGDFRKSDRSRIARK